MSEGNASVEVAALKAEINIDLDKFEESLDQATEMFQNFADNIDRALEINLHINDEDLSDAQAQVDGLKDSLSNVTGGDISENINSEGSEETIEQLEQIKELEEEISNYGIDVDLSNDDIDTVIEQLEEVKAMQSEINDTDENLTVNVEDIDNAIAQLQELKETEEEASEPIDINIEANGAGEVREEVEGIGEAEDETKEAGQGLTETLGTAIYALQAVYSALSRIAESSLEQFAQLQISGEIATRTFGTFGDNLNQFADTSVNALGMTSGETLHYADTLGLALKSQGASNQVAEQMAKSLIGVADNLTLASGGSMTMQQSVQVLTSAIAGQTFGLKSLGINVTGVNKKWTPLHQAMYIMSRVTKDVTSNFGTLGQNMNTTAGEIQKTKAITGQFAESIGEVLAPQLAGLNKHLASLYKDWNGLSTGMKKGIIIFLETVVGVLAVASALYVAIKAVEAMETVFETLTGIMELNPIVAIITAIIVAVVLLYESWKHNWLGMRNIIDNFINFMKRELNSLKPAFEEFKKLWIQIKPVVDEVLKFIGDALVLYIKMMIKEVKGVVIIVTEAIKIIAKAIKGIEDIIKELKKIVGDVIRYIENKVHYIENTFKEWQTTTGNVIKSIVNFFKSIPRDIGKFLDDAKNTVVRWGRDVGNFFTKTIPHWMNEIKAWFETLPAKIEFGLGYAVGTLVKWGAEMYDYLTSNIPKWIDDIGHWFEKLPGRIGEWLKASLYKTAHWDDEMLHEAEQIGSNFLNSIGSWFEQLPGRLWDWFINSFQRTQKWKAKMINEAEQAGSNFLKSIGNWFKQLPGKIGNYLWKVIGKVVKWGNNIIITGHKAMSNFANSVINAVKNLPSEMGKIGSNIIHGLWAGLESEWGGLMSWVHNAAHSIVAGFKSALDIHSPSREMYREVGAWILPGISQAVDDGMPTFLNNITDKVSIMVNHMSKKLKEGIGGIKVSSPEINVPWSTPRMVNNSINATNPVDAESSNIQTTGVIGGQTNHFTINESNNANETANQVIHKLRLAHFGLA